MMNEMPSSLFKLIESDPAATDGAFSVREGRQTIQAERRPAQLVGRVATVAIDGLQQFYLAPRHRVAFTWRRSANGRIERVGESVRYGAIVVLGAGHLDENTQRSLFCGNTALDLCGQLLTALGSGSNLGDAALLTWAAGEHGHPDTAAAVHKLRELRDSTRRQDTVTGAWMLSALLAVHDQVNVESDLQQAHARLVRCFNHTSDLFSHYMNSESVPWCRAHVACFADQIYSIQALASYHRRIGDQRSLDIATRCAAQIVRQQGQAGQWWWHYDTRTGGVVEEYPVYSVHQDAMAPMALFELQEAGGPDLSDAIHHGLTWVRFAPEVGCSLIDDDLPLIWRKVGRCEPRKFVRASRSITTKLHPALRMKWLDRFFPPSRIDFECRPYHLGWILYTWLRRREY